MKRFLAMIAAALFVLPPVSGKAADRLDTLMHQLDRLEPMFWRALAMKSDTEYHQNADQLLSDACGSAREIQRVASRAGGSRPNLTAEMNKIRTIFQEVEPFSAQSYRFTFLYTSLRDYEREFYRNHPEFRKKREKPTLKNIDVSEYRRWLDDIVNKNASRIRRRSSRNGSGAGKRTDEMMKTRVITFFGAVAAIRTALAEYRQANQLIFPE